MRLLERRGASDSDHPRTATHCHPLSETYCAAVLLCWYADAIVCMVLCHALCRVEQVAVWTDGAMSQAPWGAGGGNPELSTCSWFVPELLRWVNDGGEGREALASAQ